MYGKRCTPVVLFVFAACSSATGNGSTPVPAPPAASAQAQGAITAADVQRRVSFLASDALRGRDTPSQGLEDAARYAAEQFRSFGLQAAGDSGTFIRRFNLNDVKLDASRVGVEARTAGAATQWQNAKDFFVIPARVDSTVDMPLFIGRARPGIAIPAEARGRILVAFIPDTATQAFQATAGAVLQASFGSGAAAVVLVLDPLFSEAHVANVAHEVSSAVLPMPVVGLRYDAAVPLFRTAGLDLAALRERTDPTAQTLQGVVFAIRTPMNATATRPPNIVALLQGADPQLRDQFIVFSAHIDHVGVGAPDARGDSIYNGADDNASGTSAVLEIAEAFAALERKPARSILFLLVSGEEKGLLGSQAFVKDPNVPTAQMVANINIDMIGRNAPDTVVAIGQDYSSLGPTVQRITRAHPELKLVVAPDLWPQEQLFFRSDHFSFAASDIPAIFFTAGLHEQYHRPSDEANLIDNDKIARIAQLLFQFALELANAPEKPQWTPEGQDAVRRATGRGN